MSELVLLHGVGLNKSIWQPLQEKLPGSTIAIDLPGHGTQPPLTAPLTLDEFADDVYKRLPAGEIDLLGFSLGALTAMNIAARYPDKVKRLILLSAVCDRTPDEQHAVTQRLETARTAYETSMERAIERWYPAGSQEAQTYAARTREILFANDRESYLYAYSVFTTGDQQVVPLLTKIIAPTLAITGELDPGSTPEMSYRLEHLIPNCQVKILAGARHMIPDTHVSELATEITTFCA